MNTWVFVFLVDHLLKRLEYMLSDFSQPDDSWCPSIPAREFPMQDVLDLGFLQNHLNLIEKEYMQSYGYAVSQTVLNLLLFRLLMSSDFEPKKLFLMPYYELVEFIKRLVSELK